MLNRRLVIVLSVLSVCIGVYSILSTRSHIPALSAVNPLNVREVVFEPKSFPPKTLPMKANAQNSLVTRINEWLGTSQVVTPRMDESNNRTSNTIVTNALIIFLKRPHGAAIYIRPFFQDVAMARNSTIKTSVVPGKIQIYEWDGRFIRGTVYQSSPLYQWLQGTKWENYLSTPY